MLEHPLYETAVWDLKPTSEGKLAVGHGRGGPLDIAWEVHGRGPIRIVVSAPSNRVDLLSASRPRWLTPVQMTVDHGPGGHADRVAAADQGLRPHRRVEV